MINKWKNTEIGRQKQQKQKLSYGHFLVVHNISFRPDNKRNKTKRKIKINLLKKLMLVIIANFEIPNEIHLKFEWVLITFRKSKSPITMLASFWCVDCCASDSRSSSTPFG